MNLAKTAVLTFFSTFIRMLNGFFLNKIIANFAGPTGIAFIGQFASFVSIVTSFASGAVNTGVIKYTAEFGDSIDKKAEIWSAAIKIALLCTTPVALIIFFFSNRFSSFFFKTGEFSIVFEVFGCTLVFFVLNNLILNILNGSMEIRTFTIINIIQSFVGLFLTGGLTYYFGLKGALLAFACAQSVVFFAGLKIYVKQSWFKIANFTKKLDRLALKRLLKFTLMALTTAIIGPAVQIFVRDFIAGTLSWDHVGYWEGLCRITQTYLMLITTTLNVYYLPKLSSLTSPNEIQEEILKGYRYVMPIVIAGGIAIYFFRVPIIKLLFSEKFLPMQDLFFWQLTGEVVKIAAWLITNIMLAKAMAKFFILTEIFFSVSYVVLIVCFVPEYGLVGAPIAFTLNFSIYFGFMLWSLRRFYVLK
ncbi:MAG: O-antigen translocase [Candidatus Rifleibacteriota bacterium]